MTVTEAEGNNKSGQRNDSHRSQRQQEELSEQCLLQTVLTATGREVFVGTNHF